MTRCVGENRSTQPQVTSPGPGRVAVLIGHRNEPASAMVGVLCEGWRSGGGRPRRDRRGARLASASAGKPV